MSVDLLATEHRVLMHHAAALVADLARARKAYRPTKVTHDWHVKWAERLVNLSNHLGAALELTVSRRYPSAFVVIRTSLEQHLIDRLVFLATKVTQEYQPKRGVLREETEALLDAWKADEANPVIQWRRIPNSRNYLLIYTGYRVEGDPDHILSEYYVLEQQYDPFHGYAKHQGHLQRNFWTVDHHTKWSDESAILWKKRFNPSSIIGNLLLNDLVTEHEAMQIDIQYGFLSAFTHPTGAGYGIIQGRQVDVSAPSTYDHYASELLLLYVIRFADLELTAFEQAFERPPACTLDWKSVRDHLASARPAAEHLWFLGGGPQAYDRAVAANDRMFDVGQGDRIAKLERIDPDSLAYEDIGYARNPLERTIQMHSGFTELTTGIGYRSPWLREDARLR
jgi:hypothetical protein